MLGVVAGAGRIALTNALSQVGREFGLRHYKGLWEVKQLKQF